MAGDKERLKRRIKRIEAERDAALAVSETMRMRLVALVSDNKYELPQALRDELFALARGTNGEVRDAE